MQRELTEESTLLEPDGTLTRKGYARRPILEYDRDEIASGWHRIKEWDYYAVWNPEYGIAFTVADLGYVGLISVVWLDFEDETYTQDETVVLLPRGEFDLPSSSETGDVRLSRKGIDLAFVTADGRRRLRCSYPGFDGGRGIDVDLALRQPPTDDSIVIVSDWEANRERFYYNEKVNCMPAEGEVALGDETYHFDGESAFGVLDWGRGAWTYRNTWYWASASTKVDGVRLGWNLGYGFGDRSHASENAVFYDGDLHKLEDVTFEYDDYLEPWTITSSDGCFEMTFDPVLDRSSETNLLVIRNEQHQVFGHFSGQFTLEDGQVVEVEDVLGFAEEVYNRW